MEGTVTISLEDYDNFRDVIRKQAADLDLWNEYLEYANQFPEKFHEALKENELRLGDFIFEQYKKYRG